MSVRNGLLSSGRWLLQEPPRGRAFSRAVWLVAVRRWFGLALAKNSSLTRLDLRNNGITSEGAQLLAAGLHESGSGSKLRLLDLQQNKIDKPGKAALQRVQERVGGGSGEGLAVNY